MELEPKKQRKYLIDINRACTELLKNDGKTQTMIYEFVKNKVKKALDNKEIILTNENHPSGHFFGIPSKKSFKGIEGLLLASGFRIAAINDDGICREAYVITNFYKAELSLPILETRYKVVKNEPQTFLDKIKKERIKEQKNREETLSLIEEDREKRMERNHHTTSQKKIIINGVPKLADNSKKEIKQEIKQNTILQKTVRNVWANKYS